MGCVREAAAAAAGRRLRRSGRSRAGRSLLTAGVVASTAALALPFPAGAQPPGSATYQDALGDGDVGPDIGMVSLSEDAAGRLTFAVGVANRPVLLGGESVQVYLETDSAGPGDDYLLAAFDAAAVPYLARWSGSAWSTVRELPDATYAAGSLTFHVARAEIGASGPFGFAVASFVGDDPSRLIDVAPDEARLSSTRWLFAPAGLSPPAPPPAPPSTATPPPAPPPAPAPPPPPPPTPPDPAPPPAAPPSPPPPAPPPAPPPPAPAAPVPPPGGPAARLQLTRLRFSPVAPRAGSRFTVRLVVRRDARSLRPDAIDCRASVGRSALPVLGSRLAEGVAECAWRVPRSAVGRPLSGRVQVKAGAQSATAMFRRRVRGR